jgi:hypothetical protein
VVTPEVPTGRAVGQAIFSDETDGQLLDPARVQAVGQSQVREITGKATTTAEAAMARERDDQINGSVSPSISKVVEGASAHGIPAGAVATARARACRPIAATPRNARLGQILNTRYALGYIRDVFPWTSHGVNS